VAPVLIKETDPALEASRSDQVSDTGAATSLVSPNQLASSLQMNVPKVYSRDQERSKFLTTPYQKNFSVQPTAQTKATAQQQHRLVSAGAEESQSKSFFERCVNLEYLSKSDSKDFSDFIFSLKDQYNTARYIRQSKSHPVEASKTVRLKRDFKSSLC
jgi:hypothetical protein